MSVALNNIQSVDRGEDEKVRSYIKRSLKKKKQEKIYYGRVKLPLILELFSLRGESEFALCPQN